MSSLGRLLTALIRWLPVGSFGTLPVIRVMPSGAMLLFLAMLIPQPVSGQEVRTHIANCNAGDKQACGAAGLILSDPSAPQYDVFISLRYLQDACFVMDGAACGRLALIFFNGEGDVDKDWDAAANFSQKACSTRDRDGCDVAEAIFADAGSAHFDATNALRYRKVNCDFGRWQSCMQLARIYYNLGDYRNGEQVAVHACGTGGAERQSVCDLASSLKSRRIKMEQAAAQAEADKRASQLAQQERARSIIDSFLRSRDYDSAIYAAIYHSRTTTDAEYALTATYRAGAMRTVYVDNLYVLDYWFPSGNLNQIVNNELRSRSSGNDCGIFNCTNMPGASSQRWAAQNGANNRARSASSAPSSRPSMPSSAEITKQVRDKYRTAHCTMNNNANRNLC